MTLNADRLVLVNASHFHCMTTHQQRMIYCASDDDVISYLSFVEALNPQYYRSLFRPFARVIVDAHSGECVLIRDHLGLRPLYYCYHTEQLVFGDTLPDILCHLPNKPSLLDAEVNHLFADINYYTDNTIYQGIKRVEPGHMVRILPDGHIVKSAFWQLSPEGETLHYHDDREYLEHFTSLMQESVKNATQGSRSIAAEFSAGMDSTAVYGTCAQLELNPTLFMHAALPDSANAQTYNDRYERAFMAQFPSATIRRCMADDFDPIRIFKDYAEWFGGPSPYVFELFAHNIHKAVSKQGHTILLSGFGGDQGVSSHIPARFTLPSLIGIDLSNTFKTPGQQRASSMHPYHRHYFKTLREAEWSFLQGPNSHELRMRIEYSSIVAKKMGFEYRYPLLHPKLLEFFLNLPLEQKRHQGVGRYMMLRYLAQVMPMAPLNTYKKKEGLNIMPATMDTFKAQWDSGLFQNEFQSLPKTFIEDKSPHKALIKTIQAFMLNERFNYTR